MIFSSFFLYFQLCDKKLTKVRIRIVNDKINFFFPLLKNVFQIIEDYKKKFELIKNNNFYFIIIKKQTIVLKFYFISKILFFFSKNLNY